ncbi:peroxide stress protein YaaA [Nocardioides sp. R-C-SC26]|uniref:peroxide stress protein YaaA n=1 Tax=Nocardioides sp. R-C-SC26 TaxID=2870414 RepID=UPI001E564D9E|nr:peroxide stress protein YaaA [Nocardioides sp. R-C-SC26]
MLILLPPSEGKARPIRGKPLELEALGSPILTSARAAVLDALVALCADDPATATATLGIPATQPELTALNAALRTSATARADAVYTGVLFDALGLATLDAAARRRATARVAVTSSLFGMVRPGDRIPSYRLSGDAVLPSLGPVAAHWRAHLGPAVTDAVGSGLLIDLRSTMYAAFWRPPSEMASRVATVRVLHEANGKRSVVSHFNKATKGRIVRALVEDGRTPRTPAALAAALIELGWHVEVGAPTAKGTQLDVVVTHVG